MSTKSWQVQSFGSGSFPGNGVAKMTPEEKEVAALNRWYALFYRC
ncbi:MAG: hypothetical protein ACRCZY_03070 [Phocaeicola sp.]